MASTDETDTPRGDDQHYQAGLGKKHWLEYAIFLFVVATAVATGLAAWYTRQQWLTMEGQLAVTRDTEIRQLRAYLHVGHTPLIASDRKNGAIISINHAGVTPAFKIRLDATVEIGPYLLNQTKLGEPIIMGGIPKYQYAILYGAQPIQQDISIVFEPDAMRLIKTADPLIGDHRFYLHGMLRYFDIFGTDNPQLERRYEFCFVFHPDREPTGSEKGCEQYNKPG
jgi:hypothetical protein